MTITYQNILDFWFDEITPKQWFEKNNDFDQMLRDRFLDLHASASQGELFHWRDNIEGRLAEIIVLDQFSRNMFRDDPKAFAYDGIALVLAQESIQTKQDQQLKPPKRSFLYMPFMHSESLAIHEEAVKLFSQPGLEDNYEYELKHKVIIERFGRYPHRNELLGRTSTPEEIAFLQEPDSHF